MTGERVIDDATVLVSDGVIRAVGAASSIKIPKGARVIDAQGMFLLPGLGEMHAHVPAGPTSPYARDDVLFLWVANGVTVARGMLGVPEHLQLRADLASHRILGPRLITSGPSFNGSSVQNPEQGTRMVREQKAAGYDFLKLHPGLSRESFLAIAQTAREAGIPFAGHVSQAVGLQLALEQGQRTVDHLDGYLLALVPPAAREGENPDNAGLVMKLEPALLPEVARMTRAAGTWVVPTETLYENMLGPDPVAQLEARPEMRYVPRKLREQYSATKRQIAESPGVTAEFSQRYVNTRRQLIRALHDGGVGMLLGSGLATDVQRSRLRRTPRVAGAGRRWPHALRGVADGNRSARRVLRCKRRVRNGRGGIRRRPGAAQERSAAGHRQYAEHRGCHGARSLARPGVPGPRSARNRKAHGSAVSTPC